MNADFDVTIIGAGPAGISAAIIAAREGLRVALIERKTRISSVSRSCCSSLIIEPDTHGEQVTLLDGNICFKTAGFSVPYNGPSVPLVQAIRFSPGGNKLVFTQGGAHLKKDPNFFCEPVMLFIAHH